MSAIRPPRTEAHRQRDTYLQQFADLGLTPVLSTNGGIPDADIQLVKTILREGGQHGEIVDCWLTQKGQERLRTFARPRPKSEGDALALHGDGF